LRYNPSAGAKSPQVVLAEELELEADDQEGLGEFLERRVGDATRRAMRGAPPSAAATLPLVRLRVRLVHWMLDDIHGGCPSRGIAALPPRHDVLVSSPRHAADIAQAMLASGAAGGSVNMSQSSAVCGFVPDQCT
jgi:hypothetical protein